MREPDVRFRWFLSKTYGKLMSDNWFDELDPVEKALMFFNWIEDYNDKNKLLENQGYLIGSFINPEMVQKLLGGSKYEATDEEFDKFSEKLLAQNRQEDKEKDKQIKRRKRRKIKE